MPVKRQTHRKLNRKILVRLKQQGNYYVSLYNINEK